MAVEREPVLLERRLQSGDELAAKDSAEHLDRQEEPVARRDPMGVVGSEAARGGNAVDMGMMLESLVPGMEHAEGEQEPPAERHCCATTDSDQTKSALS
jgi:hypothetical protein